MGREVYQMNIERNIHGAYVIADMVTYKGETWRESKQFYGYTKRDAMRLFREHLKENGYTVSR
jgi:hypothetical protein